MIKITMTDTQNGGTVWSYGPASATRLCDLARMILPGIGDVSWEAARTGKTAALLGPSLDRLAKLTVTEPDKGRARFVKWSPNPRFAKTTDETP